MKENLPIFFKYIKQFISYSGMGIVKLAFYSLMTGITQGVGIFMLIPFLNVIGISGMDKGSTDLNRISGLFIDIFRFLNVPLNLVSILIVFMLVVFLSKFITYKQTILSTEVRNSFIGNLQARLFKSVILLNGSLFQMNVLPIFHMLLQRICLLLA